SQERGGSEHAGGPDEAWPQLHPLQTGSPPLWIRLAVAPRPGQGPQDLTLSPKPREEASRRRDARRSGGAQRRCGVRRKELAARAATRLARRALDRNSGELFDRRQAGGDLRQAVVPQRPHALADRGSLDLLAAHV